MYKLKRTSVSFDKLQTLMNEVFFEQGTSDSFVFAATEQLRQNVHEAFEQNMMSRLENLSDIADDVKGSLCQWALKLQET